MFFNKTTMFITFPQYFLAKQQCLQLSHKKKNKQKKPQQKDYGIIL